MSTKYSSLTSHDLQIARDVQARFLPYRLPRIEGLDFCGDSRPAAEMDGDFFDLIQDRSGRLIISVGEVSGEGIGAAILMSGIQSVLRGLSRASTGDILTVVRELNRIVYEVSPDDFSSSLFCARLDCATRQLQYVSAGAEPALLIRSDGTLVHRLESTGAVLGLTPRASYSCRTLAFEPGDMLVAFTDGIPDTTIPELVRRHPGVRASDLVSRIMTVAGSIDAPPDDYTVVAVRCESPEPFLFSRSLKAWAADDTPAVTAA